MFIKAEGVTQIVTQSPFKGVTFVYLSPCNSIAHGNIISFAYPVLCRRLSSFFKKRITSLYPYPLSALIVILEHLSFPPFWIYFYLS